MSVQSQHKRIGFLIIWGVSTLLGALVFYFDLGKELEQRTWDWRVQATAGKIKPDPRIKIITINQESLTHFSEKESISWPWPRELYGAVIEFLKRAGAYGVAFDIIYSEPSSYGVGDDVAFTKTFDPKLPVISAITLRTSETTVDQEKLSKLKERMNEKDFYFPPEATNSYLSLLLPIEQLIEKSSYFGNVTAHADSDGVYRTTKVAGTVQGMTFPSLPAALLLVSGFSLPHNLEESIDRDGLLTINFRGPEETFKTYPIDRIIYSLKQIEEGKPPLEKLEDFKDSFVFVGMTAPGLLDLRPSPLAATFPGVEINATILDNLLRGDFIKRVSVPLGILMILTLSFGMSAPIFLFRRPSSQLLATNGIAILTLFLLFAGAYYGYWLPCISTGIAMITALLSSLGLQYRFEGMQHRFIKNAFKFYVSPEVIDRIIVDPSKLSLGGERRELTIFFSDLAGFTSISEKMDPHDLSTMLNEFLTAMTDIILGTGGTLDKYEGDAIIAFWNAPLDVPDHASVAVRGALLCQEKLAELRETFQEKYKVQLHMRVGLNTGEVSVGNFGSRERFNYTIIGDAANLASRLEGVNKVFGTSILFSETTRKLLSEGIKYRKVGNIQVVGKAVSIAVYEPVSEDLDTTKHDQAMALFEKGALEEALKLFESFSAEPLYQRYIGRIQEELKKSRESFDPAWKLDSK